MRKCILAVVIAVLGSVLFAQQPLNSDGIIKLIKAGMSDDLIVSTINSLPAAYDTSADGLIALKASGASEKVISAILARVAATASAPRAIAAADDLTSAYKKYRNSVVTVLAEYGPAKGTGFVVDKAGLIVTNQHVVSKSEWVAVQVNESTRLPAKILAADPERDVAVLWVNLSKAPTIEPVVLLRYGDTPAEEGERVFTIGSPLNQSKILTTGIVSKVEDRAIISDININHGNSGGPLFNSRGTVIGITTFMDLSEAGGAGVAGIVRIEQALPLIERAKSQMSTNAPPSDALLPMEPVAKFPIDALKDAASKKKFKADPYVFWVGDFDLTVITPILNSRTYSALVEAGRAKGKRNQRNEAAKGTFEPLDGLKNWEEYVGEYTPVIYIRASPKLIEGFWSAFGRGMAASHGYVPGPARLHFKTDFYKMELFCGEKEVQPIWPGKSERVLTVNNQVVRVTDATFDGLYEYPSDAIKPSCGKVTLKVYSEKNPNKPKVKELEEETVVTVFRDFAPYRVQEGTR